MNDKNKNIGQDDSKKKINVRNAKINRKMKFLDKKLNKESSDIEEEEDDKFIDNMKKGISSSTKRLKYKYDEFGTEFTPFNMNEELEEGNIDDTGYFIQRKRIDDDPWYNSVLEETKKKESQQCMDQIKQDNGEKEESLKNKKENEEKNENDNFNYYGEEDLYYKEEKISNDEINQINLEIKKNRIKLLDYLIDNETVNQALNRLKPKINKQAKNSGNKKRRIEEADSSNTPGNQDILFKELLEIISNLTELSYFDVYSDSYEKIEKKYGKKAIIKWYYKTVPLKNESDMNQTNEYGPYETDQILSWIKQGLLDDSENLKIEFKIIDKTNSQDEWISRTNPIISQYIID